MYYGLVIGLSVEETTVSTDIDDETNRSSSFFFFRRCMMQVGDYSIGSDLAQAQKRTPTLPRRTLDVWEEIWLNVSNRTPFLHSSNFLKR